MNSNQRRTNRREQNNRYTGGRAHGLDNMNDFQNAIDMSLNEAGLSRHVSAPLAPHNQSSGILNNSNNYSDDYSNLNPDNFDDMDSFQRAIQESLLEQKPKTKEISFEDALEISKKETELHQQIHDEIYNQKGLLRSILHRLNGVNPFDPIFNEFFTD